MKVRRKAINPRTFKNIVPEQIFEDKSDENLIQDEESQELSPDLEGNNNITRVVSNLDVIIGGANNFEFVYFNKLDLDNLDIISEETIRKELFQSVVVDIANGDSNESRNLEHSPSPNGLEVSSSNNCSTSTSTATNSSSCTETTAESVKNNSYLSKRALKRKEKLEQSKRLCPVRTTARHFSKMLEFFETNPGLATGQLPKVTYRKKWRELSELLNKQGIGEKTTEKWQKTWSDYKLHLRKKMSGIKRSGRALNVPNRFSELDMRALSNMGISLRDEHSKISITKRFNPDVLKSNDSFGPSIQSTTHSNVPTSTTDGNPISRKKLLRQLRFKKRLLRKQRLRKFRVRTSGYYKKSLHELLQLRLTVDNGLNRIADVLERLLKTSEVNSGIASHLAEAAVQVAATAANYAEMFSSKKIYNLRK